MHDENAEEGCEAAKTEVGSEHMNHSAADNKFFKLKWDAMCSHTLELDLIKGPVLGMSMWKATSTQSHGQATTEKPKKESSEPSKNDKYVPDRVRLMLWMDRLKVSLCTIKILMGPEWLYMWTLTEYGRATIARKHLLEVISKHVAE